MDFGLFEKHETFIKERWLPISVDLMLLKGPEKKISFLKEAQQQASKEIQNIEEKSVFIGFLEIEILNIQNSFQKHCLKPKIHKKWLECFCLVVLQD